MRGSLWVFGLVLCVGCGSRVDLGGGTGGSNDHGPDAGHGGGGAPGMDAGTAGSPGMDAGTAGSPGMDAGTAGSPGMDAGVGGCAATVVAQSKFPTQYWGLALDADNLYWFSFDSTGDQLTWIETAPKTGGPAQQLGTADQGAEWLVSSGADIFFSGQGAGVGQGSVGALNGSTGKTSVLVNNVMASGVAANATSVFFADVGSGDGLQMVPRAGGMVTTLSTIPMTSQSRLTGGPVANGNDVYWIKPGPPASLEHINPVLAMPPATLASGAFQGGAQTLALSGGKLFYIDYNGSAGLNGTMDVKTVGSNGGPSTTVAKNTNAARVVADGGEVFWRNGGTYVSGDPGFYKDDGSIRKAPAAGGTPVTLVSGLTGGQGAGVLAIAVDATYLYWIEDNHTNGYRVMRTCR